MYHQRINFHGKLAQYKERVQEAKKMNISNLDRSRSFRSPGFIQRVLKFIGLYSDETEPSSKNGYGDNNKPPCR